METLSVHWGEGFGGKAGGRANKKNFISKTDGGKMENNVLKMRKVERRNDRGEESKDRENRMIEIHRGS